MESLPQISGVSVAGSDGPAYYLTRNGKRCLTRSMRMDREGRALLQWWSDSGRTIGEKRISSMKPSEHGMTFLLDEEGNVLSAGPALQLTRDAGTAGGEESFYVGSGPSSVRLSTSRAIEYLKHC